MEVVDEILLVDEAEVLLALDAVGGKLPFPSDVGKADGGRLAGAEGHGADALRAVRRAKSAGDAVLPRVRRGNLKTVRGKRRRKKGWRVEALIVVTAILAIAAVGLALNYVITHDDERGRRDDDDRD